MPFSVLLPHNNKSLYQYPDTHTVSEVATSEAHAVHFDSTLYFWIHKLIE